MAFSIAIILAIGLIVYFHYVQGLFSGLLSALCAAIASMMAMSYYEPLATKFGGKLTENAHAVSLMLLFLVLYLILRVIFDSLVPGQVRLPAIVDKIGGAVCGFIAGMFAIGTLAIAAQTMAFGPAIAGYSRYELADTKEVSLPTGRQDEASETHDELKSETWPLDDAQTMFVPADDFVVGAVKQLSDGGSLAGDRPFTSIHPSLLDETFFQRLGSQVGAKRVAFNTDKQKQVELVGTYAAVGMGQVDAEIPAIRKRDLKPAVLKSDNNNQLTVVRIKFTNAATDTDQYVRISPGEIRVVANNTNFFPLGTLENGVLAANRIDDFIFIAPGQDADFVFNLPIDSGRGTGALTHKGNSPGGELDFQSGAFLEVKRMVQFDLSGQALKPSLPNDAKGVLRKNGLTFQPKPGDPTPKMGAAPAAPEPAAPADKTAAPATPTAPPTSPPAPAAPSSPVASADASPFDFASIKSSPSLGFTINVGQHDGDSGDVKFNSGTATLADKKIAKLDVRPNETLEALKKGDYPAGDFVVPDGTKLIQVAGTVGGNANDPWEWADHLGDFALVGADGTKFTPNGAWAKVTKSQAERMVGAYDSGNAVTKIAKDEGIPTDVTLLFLVPDNVQLKALNYKGKKIADAILSVD